MGRENDNGCGNQWKRTQRFPEYAESNLNTIRGRLCYFLQMLCIHIVIYIGHFSERKSTVYTARNVLYGIF